MKVYYSRPISLFNTPQEQRDIEMLEALGFEVIDPNQPELQEQYQTEGMQAFLDAQKQADALAYRSFPDGSIGAGVSKEILHAEESGKPVIELPTITSKRVLSVEDTRSYLKYSGAR
jgi:hypothetical protein